jgi:hypothetical protein
MLTFFSIQRTMPSLSIRIDWRVARSPALFAAP